MAHLGKVRPFREELAQQAVGILVGAALPGCVRPGKVDSKLQLLLDRFEFGELLAVVAGDRAPQRRGQPRKGPRKGVGMILSAPFAGGARSAGPVTRRAVAGRPAGVA